MHNPRQSLGVISEHRPCDPDRPSRIAAATRERHPDSSEQFWILWAISWLGSAVLEGFALYGQSIYPSAVDLTQGYRAQAEEAQRPAVTPLPPPEDPWLPPGRTSHDIDIRACLATASSHSPRNIQRWFRLAAVLPRRGTEGGKRPSRERLDMPNDRSMRDAANPMVASLAPDRLVDVRRCCSRS